MNAKLLLRLAGVVIGLTLTASLASAQATTQRSGGQTSGTGEHPRAAKLREALSQLDLSADQKQQIEQIFADVKAKIKALRGGAKGSGSGEMKSQVRQVFEDAHQRIMAVLTDPQKQKFRQLMEGSRKNQGTTKTN